jgi:hypothetical protein
LCNTFLLIICRRFHPTRKKKKEEEFKNFVERSLLGRYRQELRINKFRLHMMLDESDCALMNHWIDYAIECDVKEFNLDLWIHEKRYELPDRVLIAKSIIELRLCKCKLKSFYRDINIPSLNKLVLNINVDIVTPNLHKLEYNGEVISFSLNSSSPSEVSLIFTGDIDLDAEMIEFLAKLSQPKLLTWSYFDAEVF